MLSRASVNCNKVLQAYFELILPSIANITTVENQLLYVVPAGN